MRLAPFRLLATASICLAASPLRAQPTSAPSAGEALLGVEISALGRDLTPDATPDELSSAATGNNELGVALFQAVRGQGDNVFFSPYSITTALAMTWAGARGDTATQMATALHYLLPAERQHPALNALDLSLQAEETPDTEFASGDEFRLRVANALWAQDGYDLLGEYLDAMAVNYGADVKRLDFERETEAARVRINGWVSEQTEGKIPELVPQGVLSPMTRLVLTNAVYFKASWLHPFNEAATEPRTFHTRAGGTVEVPMMVQQEDFGYAVRPGVTAVELPYYGAAMSMLVLVPDAGALEAFETALTADQLASVAAELQYDRPVQLVLPRFTFRQQIDLTDVLQALGMPNAFDPAVADFSGMTGTRDLFISAVLHEAFVAVDEEGTEAAAATAVVMEGRGMVMEPPQPIEIVVDRPFLFAIRDRATGAVLFLGRVGDPS